jgi:hypothetical protein
MSGGGGYFKYRCKNWLTYNCGEWVWVNGTACINCLVSQQSNILTRILTSLQALGRDSDAGSSTFIRSTPFLSHRLLLAAYEFPLSAISKSNSALKEARYHSTPPYLVSSSMAIKMLEYNIAARLGRHDSFTG